MSMRGAWGSRQRGDPACSDAARPGGPGGPGGTRSQPATLLAPVVTPGTSGGWAAAPSSPRLALTTTSPPFLARTARWLSPTRGDLAGSGDAELAGTPGRGSSPSVPTAGRSAGAGSPEQARSPRRRDVAREDRLAQGARTGQEVAPGDSVLPDGP